MQIQINFLHESRALSSELDKMTMQLSESTKENPERKNLKVSSQMNKMHQCQMQLLSRTSTENLKCKIAKEKIDK